MTDQPLGTVPFRRREPPGRDFDWRTRSKHEQSIVSHVSAHATSSSSREKNSRPQNGITGSTAIRRRITTRCTVRQCRGRDSDSTVIAAAFQRRRHVATLCKGKHEGTRRFEDKPVVITEGEMFKIMHGKTIMHGKNTRVGSVWFRVQQRKSASINEARRRGRRQYQNGGGVVVRGWAVKKELAAGQSRGP